MVFAEQQLNHAPFLRSVAPAYLLARVRSTTSPALAGAISNHALRVSNIDVGGEDANFQAHHVDEGGPSVTDVFTL